MKIQLLFLAFFTCFGALSQFAIESDTYEEGLDIFSYYHSDERKTINEISKLSYDGEFEIYDIESDDDDKLVKDNGYIYVNFIVNNTTNSSECILNVLYWNDVKLLSIDQGKEVERNIGNGVPIAKRDVKSGLSNYSIIQLNKKCTDTILLEINMNNNFMHVNRVRANISDLSHFQVNHKRQYTLQVFLIGVILIIFIFYLFIYITNPEKRYLFYALTLLFSASIWASNAGFIYEYLHPNTPWLGYYLNFILSPLYGIFLIRFVQLYLKTKDSFNIGHQLLTISILAVAIVPVFRLVFSMSPEDGTFISYLSGILTFSTILIVSFSYLLSRKDQSIFFLLGNIVNALFVGYFFIGNMYDPLDSDFRMYSLQTGNLLEMMFFALALGAGMSYLKKENLQIRSELQEVQAENKTIGETLKKIETKESFVVLKTSGLQIDLIDIYFVEADKNYINVYTSRRKEPYVERGVFQTFCDSIESNTFIRIHRSFYINKQAILRRPSKSVLLMKNGIELKISRTHLKEFSE